MIQIKAFLTEESDDKAFMETLYSSYSRLIYSEIKKYVYNSWDAEDLMQTVMEKLMAKVPLLRSFDRNQQVNYIIVASRNIALNFLRDNKRITQFSFDEELDWLDDKYVSPEDQLGRIELRADVEKAWLALDERSRFLLEAKYVLEKSNEEIGAEIGVSPASVRMLLTRARKKLKEALNSDSISSYF